MLKRFVGRVDEASCQHVTGWAWNPEDPEIAVTLIISAGGRELARVKADNYRPDLESAGIGNGKHAFTFRIDSANLPDDATEIRVFEESTMTDIEDSPKLMQSRLLGRLEEVSTERVSGWAWNTATRNQPVELRILFDGKEITRVISNVFRADLMAENIGTGRHGFSIEMGALPIPLTQTIVRVQDVLSGLDIDNSPAVLEEPFELNTRAKNALTSLVRSPAGIVELQARAEFLLEQINIVKQKIWDLRSNRRERAISRAIKWKTDPITKEAIKRVLFVDNTLPSPARDAGSSVIISHMQAFQRLGFQVSIVPMDMLSGVGIDYLSKNGITVLCEPWTIAVEEVFRREHGEYDVVYLHRVDSASRYLSLVRHYFRKARIIYSVADLHHLRLQRQAQVEDRPELMPFINATRFGEFLAAASCDICLTHSSVEARVIKNSVAAANVFVMPWAVKLATLVDDFAIRRGVGFIGSFNHAPNFDAAVYLLHEIMPLVWEIDSDITLFIAGSAMPSYFTDYKEPRVSCLGRVEDVGEFLSVVRMTVAPLNYGAGIKGKVVDSLAAGVPCICTPIAAEGFDFTKPLDQLVALGADLIAQKIVELYHNKADFMTLRAAGIDYISNRFSESLVDLSFQQLLKR